MLNSNESHNIMHVNLCSQFHHLKSSRERLGGGEDALLWFNDERDWRRLHLRWILSSSSVLHYCRRGKNIIKSKNLWNSLGNISFSSNSNSMASSHQFCFVRRQKVKLNLSFLLSWLFFLIIVLISSHFSSCFETKNNKNCYFKLKKIIAKHFSIYVH